LVGWFALECMSFKSVGSRSTGCGNRESHVTNLPTRTRSGEREGRREKRGEGKLRPTVGPVRKIRRLWA